MDGTRNEFLKWAVETTEVIKSLLPSSNPELRFDPYWASFYPVKIDLRAGENTNMALRIKNYTNRNMEGRFHLKSYGNLSLNNPDQYFMLLPDETKDIQLKIATKTTDIQGIYVVTANIIYDNKYLPNFRRDLLKLANKRLFIR